MDLDASTSQLMILQDYKDFLKINQNPFTCEQFITAERAFEPEDIVLEEKPIIEVPFCKQIGSVTCLGCLEFVSLRKFPWFIRFCNKCQWPLCSQGCLARNHIRNECPIFAKRKVEPNYKIEDYENIQVLRCLLMKQHSSIKWKQLRSITTPAKCIEEERLDQIVEFVRETCGLEEFEPTLIQEVAHTIRRHSFNNINEFCGDEDRTVSYLYEFGSKFMHSCAPNSSWAILPNGRLQIKAIKKIVHGEAITISHKPLLYGTRKRRDELRKKYGFWCKCKMCNDRTELGTFFSGITCTECEIGTLLACTPLEATSVWACNKCTNRLSSGTVDKILEKIESEVDHCLDRSDFNQGMTSIKLLGLLDKYEGKGLHPNHYLIYRVRNEVLLRCWNTITNQSSSKAQFKLFAKHLISDGKKCMQIADVFWPGKTAQRGRFLACIFYGFHNFLKKTEGTIFDSLMFPMKTRVPNPYGNYKNLEELFRDAYEILHSIPDNTNGEHDMAYVLERFTAYFR